MAPDPHSPAITASSSAAGLQQSAAPPSPWPPSHRPVQAQDMSKQRSNSSAAYSSVHRRASTNSKVPLPDMPASLSPTNSRCTSPKLSRDARASSPPSPPRSFTSADTSGGLFERDVEFPSEHILNAQEAQDVAIPPILQEAAEVLTGEDLPPQQVQTMMRSAASSSALSNLGSISPGWQSPVQVPSSSADVIAASPSPTGLHSPLRTQQANYSSNSFPYSNNGAAAQHAPVALGSPTATRRSAAISPSRISHHGGSEALPRAGSPISSILSTSPPDSALFTPSTSPSPPPTTNAADALSAGSFDHVKSATAANPQTIQSRMGWAAADDDAANHLPASAMAFQEPAPPRKPPLRPELMRGSNSDALQLPGAFPSGSNGLSSARMSPSGSQQMSYPPSPSAMDADATTLASSHDGGSAPRNRRLSFMSYADIINSERAEADLAFTANGGNVTSSMSMHQLWQDLPAQQQSSDLEDPQETLSAPVA